MLPRLVGQSETARGVGLPPGRRGLDARGQDDGGVEEPREARGPVRRRRARPVGGREAGTPRPRGVRRVVADTVVGRARPAVQAQREVDDVGHDGPEGRAWVAERAPEGRARAPYDGATAREAVQACVVRPDAGPAAVTRVGRAAAADGPPGVGGPPPPKERAVLAAHEAAQRSRRRRG